ncbi:MAG TPA: nuclear transport factor 2 family protein [Ignavibacteriaceae bacterium]|nr:nuclear transport factor 2 family protein [Ignavibacteriaceae bacterium]
MKLIKQILTFIPILILSILVFIGCNSKPDRQKLESEVYDLLRLTVEMFDNKDLDGLVNRFTQDGSLKITNYPIVIGHDALRVNYENNLKLENFDIKLDIVKIDISEKGDMAFVLSDYAVSFDIPAGKIQDEGKTLLALKRVNEQWKIAAENLSSNPPVQ